MGETSIPDNALSSILDAVDKPNTAVARLFPGDSPGRQPVHVVYGGAHLFTADAAKKLGALALKSLQDHARPDISDQHPHSWSGYIERNRKKVLEWLDVA